MVLKLVGTFLNFKFIFQMNYKVTIVMCGLRHLPGSLHTGITLLFNLPLPWVLILECQPILKPQKLLFIFFIFLFLSHSTHPSYADGDQGLLEANSNLWGKECPLLISCLPLQVPVEFLKPKQLWPEEERFTLCDGIFLLQPLSGSHPHWLIFSAGKEINVYWMPSMSQPLL